MIFVHFSGKGCGIAVLATGRLDLAASAQAAAFTLCLGCPIQHYVHVQPRALDTAGHRSRISLWCTLLYAVDLKGRARQALFVKNKSWWYVATCNRVECSTYGRSLDQSIIVMEIFFLSSKGIAIVYRDLNICGWRNTMNTSWNKISAKHHMQREVAFCKVQTCKISRIAVGRDNVGLSKYFILHFV
jgi:hypothetical protein